MMRKRKRSRSRRTRTKGVPVPPTRTDRSPIHPCADESKTTTQRRVTARAEASQRLNDSIVKIINEVQAELVNLGKGANLQAEKLLIVEGLLKTPVQLETNSPDQATRYVI
jgi:hypothetical protein